MQIQGAESLTATAEGGLSLQTSDRQLQLSPPLAWQPKGDMEQRIEIAYRIEGDSYGFSLGPHDPGLPVVIDPLFRSTYSGGTGGDQIRTLATDATSVYVAGITFSNDFPVTGGAAQGSFGNVTDAFVARYSADLSQLLAATYLGGNGSDEAQAISLAGGNVFVAGRTGSPNFPGTGSGAQTANGGDFDAFVARLSSDLGTLVRATYLGGSADETSRGRPVVLNNALYVPGTTNSHDFPQTERRYRHFRP